MILYSGTTCPFSHRVRLLIAEKGLECDIVDVDPYDRPEVIARLNPHGRVPVLVDRHLTLDESTIINEYLDERYPSPPLMPVDPPMRARARLMMFNLERELFAHVREFEREAGPKSKPPSGKPDAARAEVGARLAHFGMMFAERPFVMGADFSIVDVAIAPLLWRIEVYGIPVPKTATSLKRYCDRIFERPGFLASMTPAEKAMRR